MPLATVHVQAQHGHAQACPKAETSCVAREQPVWIAAFTESSVYREPFLAQKQIRAVPLRLLQGGGATPIGNFCVVASYQYIGDLPAAKISWPRVVGEIQQEMARRL